MIMKQRLLSLVLLALLPLLAVQAQITDYDLYICGTQVTSQNASNILGDGAFSYNASTNVLTVQKDVSVENKNIIDNSIDGLTLNIARDVAFDSYGNQLMVYNRENCSMTVKGDGKLTMTNAEGMAGCFYIQGDATLTIDNMEIEAQGQNIFWGNKSSEKLVLKNSYIHAKCAGGGFGAIFELGGGITFEDCHISIPEDGYVDMTRFMGIVNQDGSIAREVLIETGEAIKTYDLTVLGERVTSLNADDILGDGSFSYDPENKVLTISGDGSYNGTCVYSNIEGITINVTQDVTLQASLTGLHIEEDATLTGAGKLTIKSESDCCIYAVGATITIDNMTIEVDGKWGIAGYPANEYLIVKGSNIHATSTDGAVCDFNSITIEDCEIIQPVGGAIDNGKIVDSEGNVAKEVTIGVVEDYPVKVCGTQVTSLNADDVLGDGAFSYNPEKKVLSVKGDATSSYTIVSFLSANMTLSVEGDVTLSSSGNVIRDASIIEGPGTLTVVSSGSTAIYQNGNMTIRNTTVKAYGAGGIEGNPNLTPRLTIENATVKAYGSSRGAINDFTSIVFNNCKITEPEGGHVDGGKIVDSEGVVAATVLIEPIDETYDLMIGQMPVTSANASDILGDGVFSYDADNKVLTINGNFTSGLSIWSQIDGLTVKVMQDATLTTTRPCFFFEANATLTGDGKLTLISNDSGIQLNEATLTIEDMTIETDCLSGIRGMPLDDHLIVRNSTIHAKGSSSAINDLTSITLDGCEITLPEGGYVDGGCIFNSEGYPATEVIIKPIEVVDYPVLVCGTRVTSLNADDVLGDGAFSYDPENMVLSVKGNATSSYTIVNFLNSGMTLSVENDVTLSSTVNVVREAEYIEGPGTLTAVSSGADAIFINGNMTIRNTTVKAYGTGGIAANPNFLTPCLTIENATVRAYGPTLGGIHDFQTIVLNGCEITTPEGGYVDGGKIVDSEGNMATDVLIETEIDTEIIHEKYDLIICGTQVTSENAADVLGNGIFGYDASTKTLTMSGNIDTEGDDFIQNNGIDGLTIHVTTDSEVSSGVFNIFANTTLTGEGKLTINAPSVSAIFVESATLTIEDMNLDVSGGWGIAGEPWAEWLIVRNSNIHATGTDGAICDFNDITLEDCHITLPEGGFVSDGKIINSEGVVATEVIITAEADAIEGIAADSNKNAALYNLSGQRVGRDYRGIVIEGGKKTLVK